MGSKSETIYLSNPMVWATQGNDSPIVLPGDGILQLTMDSPGIIILATGSVLKGIHLKWRDDTDAEFDTSWEVLLVIAAEPGGSCTIVHESLDVVNVNDRIKTTYATNALIGSNKIQIWWKYDGANWKWEVPDWAPPSYSASDISFTPANGAHWVNPDPTTLQGAVDRVAARLNALLLGLGLPIP